MKQTTNIRIKKAELEVLDEIYKFLEDRLTSHPFTDWRVVGKYDEQAMDYCTHELLWEDEEKTIPKMRDRYDSVPVPEDEYDEDMIARKAAIERLMAAIDKLA